MKKKILDLISITIFVLIPTYGIQCFFTTDINKYSNVFLVLILIFMYVLYKKFKNLKVCNIWIYLLSTIYSIMYLYGTIIDRNSSLYFFNIFKESWQYNILYFYSFFIFSTLILTEIVSLLNKINREETSKKIEIKHISIIFILLFIGYIPYFVAFFPGLLSADSFAQIYQSIGTYGLSNHHPIIHTLFIKACFSIGDLFGNMNYSVAIYSLSQLLIMCSVFTYYVCFIIKNGCHKIIFYGTLLFYIAVPVFGFYAVTMWKDVLFGVFALALMIQIYKFCFKEKITMCDNILTILFVILVALFRNNGLYAILAISLIMLLSLRKHWKKIVLLYLIPSIVCVVIVGPVYNICGIKKGNFAESVGIPLKQISGIVAEGLPIDYNSERFISKLIPVGIVKEQYKPLSIDDIKFNPNFNNNFLEENKTQFIKVWGKLLLKYPVKYIDIYMKATYGFWYIEAQGYSAHVWTIDPNDLGIKTSDNILTSKMIEYHNKFYEAPIVKYFARPAVFFSALLFAIAAGFMKKKWEYLLPLMLPFLIWVTIMIATPVNYQTRYVYSLFCTFPFIIYIIYKMFITKREENIK